MRQRYCYRLDPSGAVRHRLQRKAGVAVGGEELDAAEVHRVTR